MTSDAVDNAINGYIDALWPDRRKRFHAWQSGKIVQVIPKFKVIEVAPNAEGKAWIYVSCGAWRVDMPNEHHLEFLLLSPFQSAANVESLAMVAAMHEDPRYRIHLGKVLRIGRPWLPGSICDHFLVSLPHILGDELYGLHVDGIGIDLYWILPITKSEAEFAREFGSDALEEKIANLHPNIVFPERGSII